MNIKYEQLAAMHREKPAVPGLELISSERWMTETVSDEMISAMNVPKDVQDEVRTWSDIGGKPVERLFSLFTYRNRVEGSSMRLFLHKLMATVIEALNSNLVALAKAADLLALEDFQGALAVNVPESLRSVRLAAGLRPNTGSVVVSVSSTEQVLSMALARYQIIANVLGRTAPIPGAGAFKESFAMTDLTGGKWTFLNMATTESTYATLSRGFDRAYSDVPYASLPSLTRFKFLGVEFAIAACYRYALLPGEGIAGRVTGFAGFWLAPMTALTDAQASCAGYYRFILERIPFATLSRGLFFPCQVVSGAVATPVIPPAGDTPLPARSFNLFDYYPEWVEMSDDEIDKVSFCIATGTMPTTDSWPPRVLAAVRHQVAVTAATSTHTAVFNPDFKANGTDPRVRIAQSSRSPRD